MKNLTQYIVEAWANPKSERSFERELKDLFAKYKLADEKNQARIAKGKDAKVITHILAKYPVQILINKCNYEPKMYNKMFGSPYSRSHSRKEEWAVDEEAYGQFILDELAKGTFTKDDLVKWWKEYSDEVLKKNWTDVKWVIKQIDPNKFWTPWDPRDEHKLNKLIEHPETIFTYVSSDNAKYWKLSVEEKAELMGFYSDPVNHDMLADAINKYKKQILKMRPSWSKASGEWIRELFYRNVYLDGKMFDFDKQITYDTTPEEPVRRYRGESNDGGDTEAKSLYALCADAIKEVWGIQFSMDIPWEQINKDKEHEGEYYSDRKYDKTGRGIGDDEKLKKFADDAYNGIKFNFKDLGSSKDDGSTSGVFSSSFWTFYKHDYELSVEVDKKEVFHKVYPNVTISSSYFSGGW